MAFLSFWTDVDAAKSVHARRVKPALTYLCVTSSRVWYATTAPASLEIQESVTVSSEISCLVLNTMSQCASKTGLVNRVRKHRAKEEDK